MQMSSRSLLVARTVGDIAEREERVTFERKVLACAVGLVGFDCRYLVDDHELAMLRLSLAVRIAEDDPNSVIVRLLYVLRDDSGRIDDPYAGHVDYTLLTELERAEPPKPREPRSDLVVTGMEVNQAVQHFRSTRYLRGSDAYRDNSIPLLAYKATGVRVYVDYDEQSGLDRINWLAGELTVMRGGYAATYGSTNWINPRRDRNIMRARDDHTVNFIVPRDDCRRVTKLRVRIFDAENPGSFAREFEQDFLFFDAPPIEICLMGVNYSGNAAFPGASPESLAAPSFDAMFDTMDFAEAMYPFPQIQYVNPRGGFEGGVIDYHKDVDEGYDPSDLLGDLNDMLDDLRGDSDTIYIGMTNSGVDTQGGAGGPGRCSGPAHDYFAGLPAREGRFVIAHEFGHALGRRHAPCDNRARCDEPANQDDDYPSYPGYASDSTGEYGFSTDSSTVRQVYDPHDTFDVMSYSVRSEAIDDRFTWISPYQYQALMQGAGAFLSSRSNLETKSERYALSATIEQDGKVERSDSFHFRRNPAGTGTPTRFSFGLVGRNGRTLTSGMLYDDGCSLCGCRGDGAWPKRIAQPIAYHVGAELLRIYDGDTTIFEEKIPRRPDVWLDVYGASDESAAELTLKWQATSEDLPDVRHLFVAQYLDNRGNWRGIAPRTRDFGLTVPKTGVVRKDGTARLRVLASSGIATGMAGWDGKIVAVRRDERGEHGRDAARIVARGQTVAKRRSAGQHRLQLVHFDGYSPAGHDDMRWYDGRGVEIGRGTGLDIAWLGEGEHDIMSMAVSSGVDGVQHWRIRRDADGQVTVSGPGRPVADHDGRTGRASE